jgi:hypothetical protein
LQGDMIAELEVHAQWQEVTCRADASIHTAVGGRIHRPDTRIFLSRREIRKC